MSAGRLGGITVAIVVVKAYCPQNHRCPAVRMCPSGALKQVGMKAPDVDADACTECGVCVEFCPMGALQHARVEQPGALA
ncbi:MAG: 4Fe-4S binding protein [Anaerolineae bacterium]